MSLDPLAYKHWAAENQEHLKAYRRDWNLRRAYGISAVEWDDLFATQGKRCAICRTDKPTGKYWHTDHAGALPCTPDRIRGITCGLCNHDVRAGTREDAIRLRNAMQYVENFL